MVGHRSTASIDLEAEAQHVPGGGVCKGVGRITMGWKKKGARESGAGEEGSRVQAGETVQEGRGGARGIVETSGAQEADRGR